MIPSELTEILESLRSAETDLLHVEAKRAGSDLPKRLWETVSAFANTPGGGVLILGVDEMSGFEVTGVSSPKKCIQDLASLFDKMVPPVRAPIEIHRVGGKAVVVSEIPEIDRAQKPCFHESAGLTNGAFVRVADGGGTS